VFGLAAGGACRIPLPAGHPKPIRAPNRNIAALCVVGVKSLQTAPCLGGAAAPPYRRPEREIRSGCFSSRSKRSARSSRWCIIIGEGRRLNGKD